MCKNRTHMHEVWNRWFFTCCKREVRKKRQGACFKCCLLFWDTAVSIREKKAPGDYGKKGWSERSVAWRRRSLMTTGHIFEGRHCHKQHFKAFSPFYFLMYQKQCVCFCVITFHLANCAHAKEAAIIVIHILTVDTLMGIWGLTKGCPHS